MVYGWLNLIDSDVRTDFVVGPEHLDQEIGHWREGRFHYIGETLAVTWLSEAESARLAGEEFGMESPAE